MFSIYAENVRVRYFLNCMVQAVPSFRPSMGKTAFASLQPANYCEAFHAFQRNEILLFGLHTYIHTEKFIERYSREIESEALGSHRHALLPESMLLMTTNILSS